MRQVCQNCGVSTTRWRTTIETTVCALEDLGLLCFRGPDTVKFLQGQLSNDVTALAAGTLLRAGLHSPQGRTLALLALVGGQDGDEVLALLPQELLAGTLTTLRRYVLRAKVVISDERAAYRIYGLMPGASPPAGARLCLYEGARQLAIARAGEPAPAGAPLARAMSMVSCTASSMWSPSLRICAV